MNFISVEEIFYKMSIPYKYAFLQVFTNFIEKLWT